MKATFKFRGVASCVVMGSGDESTDGCQPMNVTVSKTNASQKQFFNPVPAIDCPTIVFSDKTLSKTLERVMLTARGAAQAHRFQRLA
jgi:hypothetical protein